MTCTAETIDTRIRKALTFPKPSAASRREPPPALPAPLTPPDHRARGATASDGYYCFAPGCGMEASMPTLCPDLPQGPACH